MTKDKRKPRWLRVTSAILVVSFQWSALASTGYAAELDSMAEHRRQQATRAKAKAAIEVKRQAAVAKMREETGADPKKKAVKDARVAEIRERHLPSRVAGLGKADGSLRQALADLERSPQSPEQRADAMRRLRASAATLQAGAPDVLRFVKERSERLGTSSRSLGKLQRAAKLAAKVGKLVRQTASDEEMAGRARALLQDLPPPRVKKFRKSLGAPRLKVATPRAQHASLEQQERLHPRLASAATVLNDAASSLLDLDQGALSPPTPADLAPTPEAPITPALTALASSLDDDPVEIYKYVLNTYLPELYAGSKKGSLGTLAEGTGNDADISSLLVSLLRAANIPARYETGLVLLTPKQAEDWANTQDPMAAVTAMETIGMAATALTGDDGSITGVQLDQHVWVRAYVPYTNYRGSSAPGSRSIWLRLDPTVKTLSRLPPPVYPGREVTFDFLGFLAGTSPGSTTTSPLGVFDSQVKAYALANGYPCDDLDQLQQQRSILPQPLRLLPYDLGVPLVQSEGVGPALAPSTDYSVTLDVDGEDSPTLSLPQVYGQIFQLSYVGDTPADVAAIQQAGTIAGVDPSVVTVDPALFVNGQLVWQGQGTSPGNDSTLTVTVNVPGLGPTPVQHDIVAGSIYAIGLATGHPTDSQLADAKAAIATAVAAGESSDAVDAVRAQALALTYLHHIDRDEKPIFGLFGQTGIKDFTEIVTGHALDARIDFLGIPVGLMWGSWRADVGREANTPVPQDNDNAFLTPVNELAGFQGSHWENRLFQEVFNSPAVSTTDGCQLAAAQGDTVLALTTVAQTSQLVGYDEDSLAEIDGALSQGATAYVPKQPFAADGLQGLEVYALINPDGTGEFREGSNLNGAEMILLELLEEIGADTDEGSGCNTCSGSMTNLANGNYQFSRVDLTLPAVGLPISFKRSYDSKAQGSGTLGTNWLHSYERRLIVNANGSVSYLTAEGELIQSLPFTKSGTTFVAPAGWYLTLTTVTGGGYLLTYTDGHSSSFDANGLLISDQDLNGNRVSLVRNGDGTVGSVIDASGRTALSFTYNGSGQLVGVSDAAGRTIGFGQTAGNLTSATDVLGQVESYAYGAPGQLISRTDKNGNTWSIAYDANGRWDQEADPSGAVMSASFDSQGLATTFTDRNGGSSLTTYNSTGNPLSVTDPLGNTKSMTWDANFDKLTDTDARGNTTHYGYDANGNLTVKTDPLNGTTSMSYGAYSRLTYQRLPDGESTTNAYDGNGNLLTSTDGLQNQTTYSYTATGQLATVLQPGNTVASSFVHNPDGTIQSMTDPTSATTTFGYDGAGHLTALTDPLGHERTMVVDARGQVNSMTDANQATTTFSYDAQGNRTSLTDPTGAKTAFAYDSLNRLSTTTDAQGHLATTRYDGNGNVTSRTDPNGHTTSYAYDLANRLIQATDPSGAVASMGFCADIGGSPCQSVDPNGNVTSRTYDPDSRPTQVTDGAGDITTTTYTPGGKPQSVTDALRNATSYGYDTDGRPQFTQTPDEQIFYTYDARGNRATVNESGGNTTTFTYDANNRELTEKNSLGQVTTYTYNADGTRATKLDANGHLTSYGYDPNKRLTSVTFADATSYAFAYDTRGHRTLEQSPDETRTLAYDSLGRLQTATDAQLQKTLTYGYDAVGNRTSLAYDGLTTGYTYDPDNRLTALTDPDGETTYLGYDPGGRRTSLAQGNGVATAYAYDQANRTLGITTQAPLGAAVGTSLPSFSYTYDPNGNPLSKGYAGGTQDQYLYDPANRLLDYTNPSGVRASYMYTTSGNLDVIEGLTATGGFSFEQSFTANAFNQITAANFGSGKPTVAYAFDANGNRLNQVSTAPSTGVKSTTSYTWNDDDRLASAALPNGQVDSFKYDANGIRVGKSDSTGSVRYLIDPLTKAILATYDAGTFLRLFNYNQNPQKLDEVFSYKTAQGTKYYPHADMLGSVYAVSDATGTEQAGYSYDVYGTRTQTSGTLSYAFGFTGREHDQDTGLIYSRARYYDPGVGQWLSKDRIGYTAGPNLYLYVLDGPTRWTDPSGNIIPVALIVVFIGLLLLANDENTGPGVGIVLLGGAGGAIGGFCSAAPLAAPVAPLSSLPAGMTASQFGALIGWGTGTLSALAQIGNITLQELEEAGITAEMISAWQTFYTQVVQYYGTLNPSAAGRADLLEWILEDLYFG